MRSCLVTALLCAVAPAMAASSIELFNFSVQETQQVDPSSLTQESARVYVPQIPEAMEIYDLYLSQGDEPLQALLKSYREVLLAMQASQGAPASPLTSQPAQSPIAP